MIQHLPNMWSRALYQWISRIHPAPVAVLVKRFVGIQRIPLCTPEGTFWIDPVSSFGQTLLQYGEYEARTAKTLRGLLREESVFVDVGANEGYFSVIASRIVGNTGRVIAVEPQHRLLDVISENLALNGTVNVVLRNVALGNRIGQMLLHLAPDTNTGSSGFFRSTKYTLPTQTVEVVTLDEFFHRENMASCDVMKMDIEGAEYDAIIGSPRTFETGRVKALILESHPSVLGEQGKNVEDIEHFLQQCGYEVDAQFPQSAVWRWQGRTTKATDAEG
jgi:FkbM family methyltransferase